MLDIGFPELLLVSVVALLIFGPERLPEVLRTVGRWIGTARRSFDSLRTELEREVGADEIRRDLHNSRIMEEARKLEQEVKGSMKGTREEVDELLGKRYQALKDSGQVEGDAPPASGAGSDPVADADADAKPHAQPDAPDEHGPDPEATPAAPARADAPGSSAAQGDADEAPRSTTDEARRT